MCNKLIGITIILLSLISGTSALKAQVAELKDLVVVRVNSGSTTSFKEGQWYLMYNQGRKAYYYEQPTSKMLNMSDKGLLAGDNLTAANAAYLVQVIPVGDDQPKKYYIRTGLGHWFGKADVSGRSLSVETNQSNRGSYYISRIGSAGGHWMVRGESEDGNLLTGFGNGWPAFSEAGDSPTSTGGVYDHAFYPVTIGTTDDLNGGAQLNRMLASGGVFSFTSQRATSMSMTELDNHSLTCKTTADGAENQWWVLQPNGLGGYYLRNYETGRYVQNLSGASKQYTTEPNPSVLYVKASIKTTSTKQLVTISSSANFSDKTCLHDDTSHKIINWIANNSNNDNPASDWKIQSIDDLEAVAIKDHLDEVSGYARPADGLITQIRNADTGRNIAEDGAGNLIASVPNPVDYSQYWQFIASGDGTYSIRNLRSGNYFYFSYGSGKGQVTSVVKSHSFTVTESDDAWQRSYVLSVPNETLCYSESSVHAIYAKERTLPNSHWVFIKSELTAEEIAEAQNTYNDYLDVKEHLNDYNTKFVAFFTDASCSELKTEYQGLSDELLRKQMMDYNLPQSLINIALKVKNNTWGDEDEMSREFRVNTYQVYSSYIQILEKVGYSFYAGKLSNPTGITVKAGDILTVFCDHAQPSNSTMQLELVKGTNGSGETYDLKKGINVFTFSEEANVFVFYQTNNMSVKLASCPDVHIHIEGGHLNGYYDKTRGHDNATWAHLREKLLKQSDIVNIKTNNFVFHMKSDLVKKACPTDMEEVLRHWDMIGDTQDELMGLSDEYIPGYSEVCRNIFNCFSMNHDYMYATNNGTYYEESTLSTVMSPSGIGTGGIWGPAHENGHLRQELINMVGTTESSNNLFSNVCVYKQGRTTQRAAAPATIFGHFASKTPWNKYDIWETTHMFYQLYLYFHVNGYMPDFYPRFFAKMRKDRMDHSVPMDIRGRDEYLKLARACCDVAQADLSEFFATYGFFVPVEGLQVGDYGTYYVTTTQEDIDETLEYMHQFPRKLGNILFIEDRVEPVLATYEGHKEGEYKSRRDDDQVGANVTAGDVGQYTTYLEEPSLPDYYYTVTTGGKVTIHGSGARGLVGFKVYDAAGQLAFLSNRYTFTLPTMLRSKDYKIVAAMGDGTDIVLTTDLPESVHLLQAAGSAATAAYDLQGRRVEAPRRGSLYISNSNIHIY